VGAAGTVMAGMIWLGGSASALNLAAIGLVLAGIIGLQLSGDTH
jgi:quaternary ammonium compound-resistance protein SugE